MYLSRLVLNPRSKNVRRDMADCHEAHRTILRAFPDLKGESKSARERFGILYRIDSSSKNGTITVLVQSMEKPDWTKLPEGYLNEAPACKPVDEQYKNIKEGMTLAFRLRANPTKKIGTSPKMDKNKSKNNGRRIPIGDEKAQIEWLKRKGKNCGFDLITVRAAPAIFDVQANEESGIYGSVSRGIKMDEKKGCKLISFASVIFEGRLRVTNREKFIETLKSGIGSGKAYGFGLVSIAR